VRYADFETVKSRLSLQQEKKRKGRGGRGERRATTLQRGLLLNGKCTKGEEYHNHSNTNEAGGNNHSASSGRKGDNNQGQDSERIHPRIVPRGNLTIQGKLKDEVDEDEITVSHPGNKKKNRPRVRF